MSKEKTDCYVGSCDNCGETYTDEHTGFSLYNDENSLHEAMDNDDWYTGYTDPEHEDKIYCPSCFKQHPDIDDKIIVDETRRTSPAPSAQSVSHEEEKDVERAAKDYADKEIPIKEFYDSTRQRGYYEGRHESLIDGFKAGADWKAKQQGGMRERIKAQIEIIEEFKDWADGAKDIGATGDELLFSHNDFEADCDLFIERLQRKLKSLDEGDAGNTKQGVID